MAMYHKMKKKVVKESNQRWQKKTQKNLAFWNVYETPEIVFPDKNQHITYHSTREVGS